MANTERYRRDDQYGRDDWGFVDRATDEVRSWCGDDEADVRRHRGEVTLSGAVDRREDERRAEDVGERISGVRAVGNRLRVGSSLGPGTTTGDVASSSVTRG